MEDPRDRRYTAAHLWAKNESDGTVSVGITFHAQEELGDVVFVQSPQAGRRVMQGEACGVIESVKAASDLHAPVSGEVTALNPEAADRPERINSDPYGTWLFRMKPERAAEVDALLDAAAYARLTKAGSGKP